MRAAAVVLGAAVAVTSLIPLVRAQDEFEPGRSQKLDGDLKIWLDQGNHPYIVPEQLEQLERRLIANGQIPER